jgi:hypothetical protein
LCLCSPSQVLRLSFAETLPRSLGSELASSLLMGRPLALIELSVYSGLFGPPAVELGQALRAGACPKLQKLVRAGEGGGLGKALE